MVGEKGSDLLPDAYRTYIHAGGSATFLVLGTGEAWTQNEFRAMSHQYPGRVNAVIDYNEALAHQIYAGSDFLIMPSRVEPCGLNQMYAMRYGTIPIVRSIGGLKDTVPDIAEPDGNGRGIRFDQASLSDIGHAIHRGAAMWHNEPGIVAMLRERIMSVDFSWENTVGRYFNVYQRIGGRIERTNKAPEAIAVVKSNPVKPMPKAKAEKKAVKKLEVTPKEAETKPLAKKNGQGKK
jgi:starch synthase